MILPYNVMHSQGLSTVGGVAAGRFPLHCSSPGRFYKFAMQKTQLLRSELARSQGLLQKAHHFNVVFWCHLLQALPRKGRHVDLGDHDSPVDALIPHALCKCLDGLHAHLLLLREEHKHLQQAADSSCHRFVMSL